MSKADEKKWRAAFRKAVLERDGYRCRICGFQGDDTTLDPHHITDRHDMPNGGYVVENGITLCKVREGRAQSCHEAAEAALNHLSDKAYAVTPNGWINVFVSAKFMRDALYRLIRSSREKAVEAAKKLSDK